MGDQVYVKLVNSMSKKPIAMAILLIKCFLDQAKCLATPDFQPLSFWIKVQLASTGVDWEKRLTCTEHVIC